MSVSRSPMSLWSASGWTSQKSTGTCPMCVFSKRSEVRFRVRYAETDQMGVVYHANYLIWMEIGRTEMCRELGFVYSDMEANDGVLLVVAEANCRYLRPARYDEEVVVETALGMASSRMVRFDYGIRSA